MTDNAMTKRKWTKWQTKIHKTPHGLINTNPLNNRRAIQVLRNDKQFLLN